MQGAQMQDRQSIKNTSPVCRQCGRNVTGDEIAITKKLINRGATEYFCVDCLAAYFEVRPEDIRERIAYFRSMGCTLFSEKNP